jgi:hypothetical protein
MAFIGVYALFASNIPQLYVGVDRTRHDDILTIALFCHGCALCQVTSQFERDFIKRLSLKMLTFVYGGVPATYGPAMRAAQHITLQKGYRCDVLSIVVV